MHIWIYIVSLTSELKQIEIMAFTITIETLESGYSMTTSETISVSSFETKELAKKEIKRLMKEEGYKKYAGHIFNSNTNTEILTNF